MSVHILLLSDKNAIKNTDMENVFKGEMINHLFRDSLIAVIS